MKKRALALILIFAFALSITALAEERMTRIEPDLIFDGTTAHCSVLVSDIGATINATAELYYGNTKLASWSNSGTHAVFAGGTYTVVRGNTYVLVVYGDIDGAPFYDTMVNTCP